MENASSSNGLMSPDEAATYLRISVLALAKMRWATAHGGDEDIVATDMRPSAIAEPPSRWTPHQQCQQSEKPPHPEK